MKKHIPNIMGTTGEGDNLLSTPLTSEEFDELNGAYPHKTTVEFDTEETSCAELATVAQGAALGNTGCCWTRPLNRK